MKNQFKILGAIAALAFSLNANAVLVIDSFTTGQAKIEDNSIGGPIVTSEIAAAEALGGFRELVVSKNVGSNADPFLSSEIGVGGGLLSFSNDSLVIGTGKVIWDGAGSAGLGSLDLSGYGSHFIFDVLATDGFFNFTLEIVTGSGSTSQSLNGNSVGQYALSLASFGDLTDVEAVILTITGAASLDVSIDSVSIPEPTSLALVGLSLLGLGALRRRQA